MMGAPSVTEPKVIIVGNEKGGSGKTTFSIHLIMGLLDRGYKVGSIDLDSKQASLSHFVENRKKSVERYAGMQNITMPIHHHIKKLLDREDALEYAFLDALIKLTRECDYIVVDTPGTQSFISRLAHSYADIIMTPINDSFVDLNLLAELDADVMEMQAPSIYSNMVWDQKKRRIARDQHPIDWYVFRNRLSNLNSRNKNNVHEALVKIQKRLGFEYADGFSERVVFRELFLHGLTVLDMKKGATHDNHQDLPTQFYHHPSVSHIAARQEIRTIVDMICA